jgi:hypothetical protein
MTPNSITDGTSQPLTAAGPVAPATGLDISALSGDYELQLEVTALSAAAGTPKARIILEDTVNAFTAAVPVALWNIQGPIDPTAPIKLSVLKDQAPSLRLGVANAKLRVNVVWLDGTTPSITLRSALWN